MQKHQITVPTESTQGCQDHGTECHMPPYGLQTLDDIAGEVEDHILNHACGGVDSPGDFPAKPEATHASREPVAFVLRSIFSLMTCAVTADAAKRWLRQPRSAASGCGMQRRSKKAKAAVVAARARTRPALPAAPPVRSSKIKGSESPHCRTSASEHHGEVAQGRPLFTVDMWSSVSEMLSEVSLERQARGDIVNVSSRAPKRAAKYNRVEPLSEVLSERRAQADIVNVRDTAPLHHVSRSDQVGATSHQRGRMLIGDLVPRSTLISSNEAI